MSLNQLLNSALMDGVLETEEITESAVTRSSARIATRRAAKKAAADKAAVSAAKKADDAKRFVNPQTITTSEAQRKQLKDAAVARQGAHQGKRAAILGGGLLATGLGGEAIIKDIGKVRERAAEAAATTNSRIQNLSNNQKAGLAAAALGAGLGGVKLAQYLRKRREAAKKKKEADE